MIPPDLQALLGASQDEAPAQDFPQEEPAPEEDPVAILDRMIQDALAFIQTQKTDPVDTATMTGILQKLQQYKAEEQKETEGLMQGKVSPRAIVKGYGAS